MAEFRLAGMPSELVTWQRCWQRLIGASVSKNLGLTEEESQISFLLAKSLAPFSNQPWET